MQIGLVTIVVPVYNAKKYLDRCVSSLVGQTYRNLEIILVDDGSADGSSDLCDKWGEKDSRIKVIHKKNAGAGMARNTGISASNGEYICFCDCDDYFHTDTVKTCYEKAYIEKADVVFFGFEKISNDGKVIKIVKPLKEYVFRDEEIRLSFIPNIMDADSNFSDFGGEALRISNMMISMPLINKIHWQIESEREVFSEDVYSSLVLFAHVKCAVVLDEAFYYYCCNNASMTRNVRENEFSQINKFYALGISLCSKLLYDETTKCGLAKHYLNFYIAAAKKVTLCDKKYKDKIRLLKSVLKDDTLQNVLSETKNIKRNIKKKLLFFFWRKKLVHLSYLLFSIKAKNSR